MSGSLFSGGDEAAQRLTGWQQQVQQMCENLGRLLQQGPGGPDFRNSLASRQEIAAVSAREIYRFRRKRDRQLTAAGFSCGFGEPAWDMLLDLYIARGCGQKVAVSSLCIAACVPATTGLRWIALLAAEGWVTRDPDHGDRRRIFIGLSDRAFEVMTDLLAP